MRIFHFIEAVIIIIAASFSAVVAIAGCVCYMAVGEWAIGLTFIIVFGMVANALAMHADDILKKEYFYANKK